MPCAQPLLSESAVEVAELLLGSISAVVWRFVAFNTAVTAVAELLPGFRSPVAELAVAVALKFAVCPTLTKTTIVALRTVAGSVSPDQLQTTGLCALQTPPALALTETKLVPAGNGNVTLRF